MGNHTFSKQERLSKENHIKELFNRGSSFNLYPFRIIYLSHPDSDFPVNQVLISVSARNFKKAVDRNSVKRRIREAYRLNKQKLVTPKKLLLAYIYTAKEIVSSQVIHERFVRLCELVNKRLEAETNENTHHQRGAKG